MDSQKATTTKLVEIDASGIYKLNSTMKSFDVIQKLIGNVHLVPKSGDILQEIKIHGNFTSATLFAYDATGVKEISYDHIIYEETRTMTPFGNAGVPLLCIGKGMYVRVETSDVVQIEFRFGLLSSECIRRLRSHNDEYGKGVKVVHTNSSLYQVVGMGNFGTSNNCLVPCI